MTLSSFTTPDSPSELFNKNFTWLCNELSTISGWYVAGGSLLLTNFANDLDIYFYNEEAYEQCKTKLGTPDFTSTFADTYESTFSNNIPITIQLVFRKFGTPEEVLYEFDLNKSRQALHPDGTLYQHPTFTYDLYVDPRHFRVNTLDRIRKYIYNKKQPLDYNKFKKTIHKLLQTPLKKIDHYYIDTTKGTHITAITNYCRKEPMMISAVMGIIETLPRELRLVCYNTFILTNTEILPLTNLSIEQQLFTSIRHQHTAEWYNMYLQKPSLPPLVYPSIEISDEVLNTYPEFFI